MAKRTAGASVVRLGIREIELREGVDERTIRRWYADSDFPKPHYLGARRAWFLGDVEAWEARRMARPVEGRRVARNPSGTHMAPTERR